MGFDNRLFRVASWIRATTSYISPIINAIDDPSQDIEAGERPGISNHVSTNCPEQIPLDMGDENDFEVSNEVNELVNEQSVTLPRKTKVYFYLFYVTFLVSYVVLVLATACKYPLKPEYDIHSPVFHKESVNKTEETKQSVNLHVTFTNRNKLASVSYDDLNITMFYLDPRTDTRIYVASSINDHGFHLHKPKSNEVSVHMSAPGLSGLLQLQEESNATIYFLVNLEYNVRFHCGFLCTHKHRFRVVEFI